jgi:hypothetical protein
MKQVCESCGRTIEEPQVAFHMKIELFADPSPPEITPEDLERDFDQEMREIIKEMEATDPRDAEDEVYEAYLFTLCAACRRRMHDELRARQIPFESDP